MTHLKPNPLVALLSGLAVLSACTNPATLGGSVEPFNTQPPALTGTETSVPLSSGPSVLGGSALDMQEADLRARLTSQSVVITNTGDRLLITLPHDTLFASASGAVLPELERDLYGVAGNLQAYPNATVQVVGHTDSDGDASDNQQVSAQRAAEVSNVLLNAGVAPGRVSSVGRGEDQPVASNLTTQGKAQNRRVEIVVFPNA